MTDRKRWGKAGVQLTPQEAAHRDRLAVVYRAESAAQCAENDRIAFEKWKVGMVVPHAITVVLDTLKLYGPEVDAACGVREPAVDLWEAGKLYPTWPQLQALSRLTGYPLGYFTTARRPVSVFDTSMVYHLPRGEVTASEQAVMRYPDDVWQRCPGTGWPSVGDVS